MAKWHAEEGSLPKRRATGAAVPRWAAPPAGRPVARPAVRAAVRAAAGVGRAAGAAAPLVAAAVGAAAPAALFLSRALLCAPPLPLLRI